MDQVVALSVGNPLAIRELIADPGALTESPVDFPRPLTVSLSQVYARRAAELDPDALAAARCAAVAGQELAVVSRACADLGVEVAALDRVEAMGLLTVGADEVRFRHPLVRSALYATAAPAIRRRLHAAAARAVDESDEDRRAWHLSEAVLGPDEPTAAAMERVAHRAADRAAYAVAASGAERAAALSPTSGSEPVGCCWPGPGHGSVGAPTMPAGRWNVPPSSPAPPPSERAPSTCSGSSPPAADRWPRRGTSLCGPPVPPRTRRTRSGASPRPSTSASCWATPRPRSPSPGRSRGCSRLPTTQVGPVGR